MPSYIDSSVLLAILQGEPTASVAVRLWEIDADRVSSRLLAAECLTVLRRAARAHGGSAGDEWYGRAKAHLQRFLAEVTLMDVGRDVLVSLEEEERLGLSRTLDAVHLATALRVRSRCDETEDLAILTFDTGMARTAKTLGFRVLPDAPPR